jgi:TnsA endonuclease N terminal/TnsA endonuclease C terminal
MGRKKPLVTEDWIARRIKEGYGQGEGADYKPWLVVQTVSSLGRVHRIKGTKHGRVHHLFSDVERNNFLYYQWSRRVTDIREQFPLLPVEETVEIAREMGVPHPVDRRSRWPLVMTTDLLLSVNEKARVTLHPRTIKYAKDLGNRRVLEKLEIERRYWAASPRNHLLKILTEEPISEEFVRNMLWVSSCYWPIDLAPLSMADINRIALPLTSLVGANDLSLAAGSKKCDRLLKLKTGTSLFVARHLIAIRYWEIDMSTRIDTAKPLILLNTPKTTVYEESGLAA